MSRAEVESEKHREKMQRGEKSERKDDGKSMRRKRRA
jgi:hypothetical protein